MVSHTARTTRARAALAVALAASPLAGQSAAEAAKLEFFEQRIRPVLASSCYECHSTRGEQRGGVALDHRAGIRAEGSEGPIVVPGEPEESVLLMVTRHEL
ncbi:MAG: c-type cytochrome domain-containing protein, partial [Planctomycetota bacterium]